MKKNISLLLFTLVLLGLTNVIAQQDLLLKNANQRIVGTDFYFDVILNAEHDPVYLGNSVLLLNINQNVFENIVIDKEPTTSTTGGSCNFMPVDLSGTNILITRNHYYNNLMVNIIENEIEIVINVDQPFNSNDFNSTIAKIDNNDYRVGTFKISNLKLPLGLIDLKWKSSCTDCGNYSEVKTIDPNNFTESTINITTFNESITTNETALKLELKIYLEGPYTNEMMTTYLTNEIPCIQPYSNSPWLYSGAEEVNRQFIIDKNIVDWVYVQLRDGSAEDNTTSVVSERAGLVNKNGYVLDIDGEFQLKFLGVDPGEYYIVIYHRNHLPVISNTKALWFE